MLFIKYNCNTEKTYHESVLYIDTASTIDESILD